MREVILAISNSKDLDEWVKWYNEERTHSGKYCFGKTPMQTFLDSLPLAKEKMIDQIKQTNFLEKEPCVSSSLV